MPFGARGEEVEKDTIVRMKTMVLAYIKDQHTEELEKVAKGEGSLAVVASYLLRHPGAYDDMKGLREEEPAVEETIKTAIKKAADEITICHPDWQQVVRMGKLAVWPVYSWDYPYGEVSFAKAIFVLTHEPEHYIDNLASGRTPHCPMRGNHEFAEAAISLVGTHPVWKQLSGNMKALLAFTRWRAGLEVGNGSSFSFMEAIGLSRETLPNDALVALATIEADGSSWAREAGRRNLPIPYLSSFGERDWIKGREWAQIVEQAPDVANYPYRGGGIKIEAALEFYKEYQDNEFVLTWIDSHVQDELAANPEDPFGKSMSAWILAKYQLAEQEKKYG